jgi:hypothetical protein
MPTIDINALPIGTLMELIGKKLSDPRQAIGVNAGRNPHINTDDKHRR